MCLILKAHLLTQKLFTSLSLTSIFGPYDGAFQQGSNCFLVMTDGDLVQSISHPIISSLLVLQSELEGGQHTYPPVPSGIKVLSVEDICQQIVVSPDHKWCVYKVLLEVFSDTPLESKELKFRAVIVFL